MIRTDFEFQNEAMYVLGKNELQIENIGDILVSKYSVSSLQKVELVIRLP